MLSFEFNAHELDYWLKIQLLIARAGQNDSLRWWEDDSLTEAGSYILERLFPFAPQIQGRKLALAAAKVRHEAALKEEEDPFYLYQFLEERDYDLSDVSIPSTPITTMDELHHQLTALVPEKPSGMKIIPVSSNGRLQVEFKIETSTLEVVNALAWAYMEGSPSNPVFPFIKQGGLKIALKNIVN